VGHAILKYKNNGIILVSSGHWIELSDLNTSIEKLETVATEMWGDKYSAQIYELKSGKLSKTEQLQKQQALSALFIQQMQVNSATYSKKKNSPKSL
jgi:hypothetical protein